MQTEVLPWLITTLLVATVGLAVASGVYGAVRAFEKWNREAAHYINLFILAASVTWSAAVSPASLWEGGLPYLLLPAFVVALCGFKFHQKSGGASDSSGEAIILMMAATLITMALDGCVFLLVLFLSWPRPYVGLPLSGIATYFYSFLLLAALPLVPFILWLYQNSRLRPGIDRHLKPGEEG